MCVVTRNSLVCVEMCTCKINLDSVSNLDSLRLSSIVKYLIIRGVSSRILILEVNNYYKIVMNGPIDQFEI